MSAESFSESLNKIQQMPKLRNQLGSLRVFDVVHRIGSVARAAELLHITPGAVSHQLRKLEHNIGVSLTFKVGRNLGFTAAGNALAVRMADLFDRIEVLLAQTAAQGRHRRVRVKVIPSFAIKWLVPRLGELYSKHEDIDIEIATVARVDDTSLNNADFVVRRGLGSWPDLRADLLFMDELMLACSPELARRVRKVDDLLGEKLLVSMIAPDSWEKWFASLRCQPGSAARFVPLANAVLCLQAATRGVGVALTQRAYLAQDLANGVLVQPLDHIACSDEGYYLVSDPLMSSLPPFSDFAEWLLDSV